MTSTSRDHPLPPPARPGAVVRQPGLLPPLVLATLLAALPATGRAATEETAALPEDLTGLSLESLMNIQVVSVSKHAEPIAHAAAAIFVITGEEIRRSGVRTIADALRLAPGVQVTRTNAQSYTVTIRGLGGDKLEVLMDGRSVYTPLTSTVFWDVLDTFLPDIERIEVIRGPGATLWGANAVNGVINIVTRNAKDTVGTMIQAGAGDEEHLFGGLRSGTRVGETGYIRFFGKARDVDSTRQADGSEAVDGLRSYHAGFRYDGSPGERQTLTVLGGIYDSRQDSTGIPATTRTTTEANGGNLGVEWAYLTEHSGEIRLSAQYDRYRRKIPGIFEETRDSLDLGFEHRISLGEIHDLTWGLGAEYSRDKTGGAPLAIIFEPQNRSINTFSAFVQDKIRLGDKGELTLGSKFEHNDFTGFEVQPGIRLGWKLQERLFTWGSVARAVRTPNRLDHDIAIFCSPPIAALLGCAVGSNFGIGNPDFDSEKLTAYEWGLRWWNNAGLSVDLALFFNDYSDLKSTEPTAFFGRFENQTEAKSKGAEVSVNWVVNDKLELRPFYAYLDLDVEPASGSADAFTASNAEGSSAQHKAGLRVLAKPRPDLTVDAFLRYMDELEALAVPSYTELDLRLAWRLRPGMELALVGQNLLDSRHPETGSARSATNPTPDPGNGIERGLFLEFTWHWQ
jgi:iron complex outermembrane recepter protein